MVSLVLPSEVNKHPIHNLYVNCQFADRKIRKEEPQQVSHLSIMWWAYQMLDQYLASSKVKHCMFVVVTSSCLCSGSLGEAADKQRVEQMVNMVWIPSPPLVLTLPGTDMPSSTSHVWLQHGQALVCGYRVSETVDCICSDTWYQMDGHANLNTFIWTSNQQIKQGIKWDVELHSKDFPLQYNFQFNRMYWFDWVTLVKLCRSVLCCF